MSTQSYTVEGMTCGHCAASVTREVGAVAGVNSVTVDLAAQKVTVDADAVSEASIAAAVSEAGYSLVGRA